MLLTILTYAFYLLFFLTPLVWSPLNHELFEFNKMFFVYFLTLIILTVWIFKMVRLGSIIINRTPLDIPLLLFLGVNILSTIFSKDPHLSIFGYYSRLNGGLLSLLTYIILYYALVSNFNPKQALGFLKAAIWGGVIVSLWAIPEHFGVSPSCLLLTGNLNASCWVQDVQARVFATLGQPNWLANYLGMLIFPALGFMLCAKSLRLRALYLLIAAIYYLAFTFTYSRGATVGLIAGLGIFLAGIFYFQIFNLKAMGIILLTFLIINILFGSSLTSFHLVNQFAPSNRESITTPISNPSVGTQLENGGTESGQIRLIVWRGAFEIFKQNPILGTGPETFAYSYYQYRPVEHNLVSEWEFLYNKAHNEFLNYLANTGALGFASYLALIAIFIAWSIKSIFVTRKDNLTASYLQLAILCSYISYLVTNFFGFSVVGTALLFFLLPAISIIISNTSDQTLRLELPNFFYKGKLRYIFYSIFVLVLLLAIIQVLSFYTADIIFSRGYKLSEKGNSTEAFSFLDTAVTLNPQEPYYRSELAYSGAAIASILDESESTTSARLVTLSDQQTESVLNQSPNNVSFLRTAIRTYFLLSLVDSKYYPKTIETLDRTIKLAPTDPKLLYNKAIILEVREEYLGAAQSLEKAVDLKPNYREARIKLADIYLQIKQPEKAKVQLEVILKFIPNDPEVLQRLDKINNSKG
ncbi:MAG: O-antigen ligase family protein [Candidatus Daviesbacteria bacterium]|nr:O-antigen ligase family protein [Candidatus Daviesbacteria bacterium]